MLLEDKVTFPTIIEKSQYFTLKNVDYSILSCHAELVCARHYVLVLWPVRYGPSRSEILVVEEIFDPTPIASIFRDHDSLNCQRVQ